MNSLLNTLSLILVAHAATAAEETSTWTEIYEVGEAPHIIIANVWGDVRVRTGLPGQVTVNAIERRAAPDANRLEASRESIWLEVKAEPQRVSLEVGGDEMNYRKGRKGPRCRGCRLEFQFDVQVPAAASLWVSTVNDGSIDVQGVTGTVGASNVNGPVTVLGLHNCNEASSVNGPVRLSFSARPDQDCELDTINGNITVALPAGAGLDLAVELFNGRLISAMDVQPLALPAKVTQTSRGSGTRYRIEKPVALRLGGGGPRFAVESLNGDVRIEISP